MSSNESHAVSQTNPTDNTVDLRAHTGVVEEPKDTDDVLEYLKWPLGFATFGAFVWDTITTAIGTLGAVPRNAFAIVTVGMVTILVTGFIGSSAALFEWVHSHINTRRSGQKNAVGITTAVALVFWLAAVIWSTVTSFWGFRAALSDGPPTDAAYFIIIMGTAFTTGGAIVFSKYAAMVVKTLGRVS